MKFSIKGFFSKRGQIHSFLRVWLNLLKKFLIKDFNIFVVLANIVMLYLRLRICSRFQTMSSKVNFVSVCT